MGHCVRAKVQQDAIAAAAQKMKEDPTLCIVIADYKMKIEPSQNREPTTEHYGKRGISYHGVCVMYMKKNNETGEYAQVLRYFDTVIEGDAAQDIGMTMSIIEDVLLRMRGELPDYVQKLIFQSDNARTYQNLLLPLLLPAMARAAGFTLLRILHTETQDGKSMADAHFQKVALQLQKYVDEMERWDEDAHKVCTANQIADALCSDEGLPATDISVLRLDRERLGELEERRAHISRAASLLLPGFLLDIRYQPGDAAAAETAHITSVSPPVPPPARTKRATSLASELAAHFAANPLRIDMDQITKLHEDITKEYEVAKVLSHRGSKAKREYKVSWKRYSDTSWLAEKELKHVAKKIAAYHAQRGVGGAAVVGAALTFEYGDNQGRHSPAYHAVGVLPVTGAQILRHEQQQRAQRVKKKEEEAGSGEEGDSSEEEEEVAVQLRMDVRSQAVREFLVAVQEPSVGISTPDKVSILDLAPADSQITCPQMARGWGVRRNQGQTKGATYTCEQFSQLFQQLFDVGEAKSGQKYSPHQMQAEVIRRFPGRYDIPSVTEIAGVIGNLVQQQKKGGQASS